jgi:hypothetical protein
MTYAEFVGNRGLVDKMDGQAAAVTRIERARLGLLEGFA